MTRVVFTVIVSVILSSCSADYRMADHKALCDPYLNEAYMVTPGAGDTSFVKRNKNLDKLCNNQN